MFSKILTFTFCTLVGTHCATSASQIHMAVSQHLSTSTVPLIHPSSQDNQLGTVKNGLYSIHSKATGGQLVAFKQSEPVLVLWNDTVPRLADLAKVNSPSLCMISMLNYSSGESRKPRHLSTASSTSVSTLGYSLRCVFFSLFLPL
jgi:hypothetical protein